MKKIIISLMLMASVAVSAQSIDHYSNIQVNLGGGVHTLLYDATDADHAIGFGGLFGLQYQFMFNHNIGIAVGAQGSTLMASTTYNKPYTVTLTHPDNGQTYDRTIGFENWKERQNAVLLSVPVQLILRAPINESLAFQAGLGAAYDIPLSAKYKVVDGSYSVNGYFPSDNVTIEHDVDAHGFGTYRENYNGNFELVNALSALVDLGVVINLNEAAGLYLGLYGQYGFQNNLKEQTGDFRPVNDPENGYVGTLNSDRVAQTFPLEAGLKVGIRFGMGKNVDWKKIKAAEEAAAAAAEAARLEQERLEAEARAKAEAEAAAAERARLEAERAKAEAEARAKAEADSIARAHAEELARQKAATEAELAKAKNDAERAKAEAEAALAKAKADAEAQAAAAAAEAARLEQERLAAEARAKAEAEARARAEEEARARAKAEQKAREEAAFLAGYHDVAYFETGKDMPIWAELNEDSWDNLKDVMDRYPDVMVTVTGHTDNVGKPANNLKLSQARADNIKTMLVMKGIAADRITAIGKGDKDPIADNKTKEGRAKNRRIEITIYRNK